MASVAAAVAGISCLTPATQASAQTPPERVDYLVSVAETSRHLFHVKATVTGVTAPVISFALPAWSPGWYVLTHAYRNIRAVAAADADSGRPLPVTAADKLTWNVRTDSGGGVKNVTLSYDLIAEDRDPDALGIAPAAAEQSYGFFAPYLDAANGFVPGPASLMYVVGGKKAPCRVTYRVPAGWQVASANDPTPDPATFAAPDYDTLADEAADLGRFQRIDRTVAGVPMSVLLVGETGHDATRWIDDTFRIAAAGIAYWGKDARPPFPRYFFQFRFPKGENGGGGLEHLNSTVIELNPLAVRDASPDDLELVAHEFFHAWNVKRARPENLGPFDYTRPVRVSELWWFEGVTDYVAPHILVSAGLADAGYWRSYMGFQIDTLQHDEARKTVTLEESSLKAWEGKSEGFGGLSYYNKGLIVGLLLDIEMRRRTGNRIGLDDLMRALYSEEAKSGRGFPAGEIERLASQLSGSDFGPFFERALRTTNELPYDEILPAAGLKLVDSAIPSSSGNGGGASGHVFRLEKIPSSTPEQTAILEAISGRGSIVTPKSAPQAARTASRTADRAPRQAPLRFPDAEVSAPE